MYYTVEYLLSEEQEEKLAELAVALGDSQDALFDFLMKAGSSEIIDRALAVGERMAVSRLS